MYKIINRTKKLAIFVASLAFVYANNYMSIYLTLGYLKR